jgi:hypothetical protein
MKRIALAATLLVVFGTEGLADDKRDRGLGSAPRVCLAQVDGKGNLTLQHATTVFVPESREITVVEGGVEKKVTVTTTKAVPRMTEERFVGKSVQAFTADGKALDAKVLAERLKKWVPVLVSTDGGKVDPAYLQLLKSDAVVLVVPLLPPPPPPPGDKTPKPAK